MSLSTSIQHELKALWGGGTGTSLVATAIGWGLLVGTRTTYPILLPYFRDAFEISLTVAGLLVTILWLCTALLQVPGGVLADRYSERVVMTISPFVVAVALALVVTAQGPIVLFAGTALIGIGLSLYPIARITILSDIYPDRIGSALGVTMATGDLGQTLIPPIAGVLAASLAWQAGLGFHVPLLVIGGVGIWMTLPAKTPEANDTVDLSLETARTVFAALRRSSMVFITFILFLYILIWQSFTGFYPTYLIEVKELSASTAALLFSLVFAVGVLAKPLAGAAYDRIGIRGSLLLVHVGPLVGFSLLPFVGGPVQLGVVTVVLSTVLGSGTITQSYLADAFADELQGTGLGVVRTIAATLGAAGPVLFGMIADRGFFDEGYFVLALLMLVSVGVTVRMPRA